LFIRGYLFYSAPKREQAKPSPWLMESEVSLMPRAARAKSKSGVYHVMLRGINRQQIFLDDEDNAVFIGTLRRICGLDGIRVYAYCLMGNHAHLILREINEPLGTAMRRLGASYVRWYNEKYARTGHLFEDRYRSEPIEDKQRLLHAIRYIHLNPVKAGLCAEPNEYLWSSYHEFAAAEPSLIPIGEVLRMVERDQVLSPCMISSSSGGAKPNEPATGLTDARAREIIIEVCGCTDASAFGRLGADERSHALRALCEKGLSASQICRLTGISYAVARRYQS
jgi:REP element-mobilizing transposase RayT